MTDATTSPRRVFAVGAHPDDVEFFMAGTLIELGRAGYEMHCMSIANGCCGSTQYGPGQAMEIRRHEAMAAAALIGAKFHPALVNDMEITYDVRTMARMAAIMRQVAPQILLVHPPSDYMEDHEAACRLAVTAAFAREMPNFRTDPLLPPVFGPVTIYHAQPHGNRTPLGELVRPRQFVDVTAVIEQKSAMLECHRSQGQWLDLSQGVSSMSEGMKSASREVGAMSGRFEYAEGWRKHLHLGFCGPDDDPLAAALGDLVATA
ncbi:MAG TPA: PIG-L deacetylase family protein [Pirellulales bacterium]|jgi:LmbE family N-acetylglucosaminyl deacetylase|nr:PIG-L deacetylase family protein [Pirellulales bacterium]